jgi:hypothetical protein
MKIACIFALIVTCLISSDIGSTPKPKMLVLEQKTMLRVGDLAILHLPTHGRYSTSSVDLEGAADVLAIVDRSARDITFRAIQPGPGAIVVSPSVRNGECISCATLHYFIRVLEQKRTANTDGKESSVALSFAQTPHVDVIVYERMPSDKGYSLTHDIWMVNSDGTNDHALTTDGHSDRPSWSPDGERILFLHDDALRRPPSYLERGDKSHHPVELYVMDRDGSNAHPFRRLEPNMDSAAWSPDGKTIAVSQGAGGLILMPVDGQADYRKVTDEGLGPTWSHDGKKIMYSARRQGNWSLYIANADGSGEVQITKPPLNAVFSAWSPDETQIAFDALLERGPGSRIFVMNVDGSNLRALTPQDGFDCTHPSWSPDGTQLAVSCEIVPEPCAGGRLGFGKCTRRLYVISPNEPPTKLAPIIQHDGFFPVFSPK